MCEDVNDYRGSRKCASKFLLHKNTELALNILKAAKKSEKKDCEESVRKKYPVAGKDVFCGR